MKRHNHSKKDNFLGLAKSRKTTYEFSDRHVKGRDIRKILESGRWSPSCSNLQPWNFIVVKDKHRIKALVGTASFGAFHSDPPLIIALVLRSEKCGGEHVCIRDNKTGITEAHLSLGMCGLSMALQAHDMGIDSCFLSPGRKEVLKILRVHRGDTIPLMIGFGYERKGAFQRKRERRKLEELVSYGFDKHRRR